MTIYKGKLIETHISLKKDKYDREITIDDFKDIMIRVSNFTIQDRSQIYEKVYEADQIKSFDIFNDLDANVKDYVEGVYEDMSKRYPTYTEKLFASKPDVDYYLSKLDHVKEHEDIIDL